MNIKITTEHLNQIPVTLQRQLTLFDVDVGVDLIWI
jgi:hypothetical protein